MRLFIRQSFTEAGDRERTIVQSVMDTIPVCATGVDVLTGTSAETMDTFRAAFEGRTQHPFSPRAFRDWRLALLDRADAMLVIRTGLSESGAFEIAYNAYGRKIPLFFAVWSGAPIKTTLLQELEHVCPAQYVTFADAAELRAPLTAFFDTVRRATVRLANADFGLPLGGRS